MISTARCLTFVIASFAAASAASAATFTFNGTVESASFVGMSPDSLADLSFSFDLDIPDPSATQSFNNVPLTSFSGLTVNGTVFDRFNVLADVQLRNTFVGVAVGAPVRGVAGIGAREDDFLVGFLLVKSPTGKSAFEVALSDNAPLDLLRAQVSNSDKPQVKPGTGLVGSVRVTESIPAPVPLPAAGLLGLFGLGALAWVGRKARA